VEDSDGNLWEKRTPLQTPTVIWQIRLPRRVVPLTPGSLSAIRSLPVDKNIALT